MSCCVFGLQNCSSDMVAPRKENPCARRETEGCLEGNFQFVGGHGCPGRDRKKLEGFGGRVLAMTQHDAT